MDAPTTSPPAVGATDVLRFPGREAQRDRLAVEAPLEIRVGGEPYSITMRTPGHDEELALGFALSEGLAPRGARRGPAPDVVHVDVARPGALPRRRRATTTSACGVCGTPSLADLVTEVPRAEGDWRVDPDLLARLPERLRAAQPGFAATGGSHATGLFTRAGDLRCVREDVGRHNAFDKVAGWALRCGLLPLADGILCVSGRLSFELVQKCAAAGCPVLVAVGAPSTLAVDLAEGCGITLCGFAREGRLTAYANAWRLDG